MTNDSLTVHSPYDGAMVGQVTSTSDTDVELALKTADALFRDRKQWLSKPKRIEILERAAALITERKIEIATQAASEGGKPLKDSITEVERGIDGIRGCIEVLRTEGGLSSQWV